MAIVSSRCGDPIIARRSLTLRGLPEEIGLGRATSIRFIEITWPVSGERQVFTDVGLDQLLIITEGEPDPLPVRFEPFPLPDP